MGYLPAPAFRLALSRFIEALVYSNTFIALCAVAQGCLTYRLLNEEENSLMLSLLFFGTFSVYNLSALLSLSCRSAFSKNNRTKWIYTNTTSIRWLTSVSLVLAISLSFSLHRGSTSLLLGLAFLVFAYQQPVFPFGKKLYKLRSVPGLKVFIIGLVWTGACTMLPAVELNALNTDCLGEVMNLSARQFLLITAITIPFDIRDEKQDSYYGIRTLPVLIGASRSKLLALAMLLSYSLLCIFSAGSQAEQAAQVLIAFAVANLILKTSPLRSDFYYYLLLDGTLIANLLAVRLAGAV